MERLLKGVSEQSWRDFKAEAARHGMRMGEFLGYLVEEHKKREQGKGTWKWLMERKSFLTEAEATRIKKLIEDEFEQIEEDHHDRA